MTHLEAAIEHNEKWLVKLTEAFEKLGLEVTPSVCNFILIDFPQTPGKTAADADTYLLERGFVLRCVGGYGFPNSLRMTIGTDEANLGVITALEEFLA